MGVRFRVDFFRVVFGAVFLEAFGFQAFAAFAIA